MNKITLGFFLAKSKTTIHGLLVLFALLLMNTQMSWGQVSITGTGSGNTYSQNFDALANAGTSNAITTLPVGWTFLEAGTNGNTIYAADTGSSNTGNTFSYGVAAATDRALGGLQSGTVIPTIGVSFTNNSGGFISELVISYTGEQWRLGTLARVDRLDFQYSLSATSLSTGTWTDVDNLDFTAPVTTGTVGAIVGNTVGNRTSISYTITGLSIASGATFWLRFNDLNSTGADDGLAVDDFSVYANAPTSTTWTTAWSYGAPTASLDAVIAGAYSEAANITAKTLTVNNSAVATIPSGNNVTVTGAVTVTAPATLTFSNNANLIQDPATTTNSNVGVITLNRNSSPLLRLDYTLWSSPVAGQNLAAFSPLTSLAPSRFYTFDTTFNTGGVNGAYTVITDPTIATFSAGAGYLIRMPNTADAGTPTAYAGQFTGKPNNGDVPVSLIDGAATGLRFNLVGNPYPSTLKMQNFVFDNTANIENTLWFWRKTNGAGTAYCTWQAGALVTDPGTFVTNGNTQTVDPQGIIQTAQGFFVEAKSGATSLTFKNSQRVANTVGQFFKTKQIAASSKIWLNATNVAGDFSQMAVTYFDGATVGLDAFDGKYINDSPFALTSNINNGEYTIQGRPAFNVADVVALNFKTELAGDYTIAIDHSEGVFASGQDIYLVDSKTGTETNLKISSYNFTAAAGVDNTRFSLKYQKTLKVDDAIFNENSVTVFAKNGSLYVNSGEMAIDAIQVYDVQGRLIAERKNVKATTATLENLKANNQVLLVKVSGENNQVVTKKVMN